MEIVEMAARNFAGISVRTSNDAEVTPENSTIKDIWVRFGNEVGPHMKTQFAFGIYTDYESDSNGEYTLYAATELLEDVSAPEGLETVSTEAGRYMVFHNTGDMPEVVIRTWQEVWDHFADPKTEHKRAYTTDYEVYPNMEEVTIYIALT